MRGGICGTDEGCGWAIAHTCFDEHFLLHQIVSKLVEGRSHRLSDAKRFCGERFVEVNAGTHFTQAIGNLRGC